MQVEIIGIRKAETKTKKTFYNYYGLKEFSDYDMENGECTGRQPVEAFSYKDYGIAVGDIVDFQYEPGFEGRAVLSNIVMVKMGGGTPFDPKPEKAEKKDGR